MKKFVVYFLIAVITLSVFPIATFAIESEKTVIVSRDKETKIIIPRESSDVQNFAANTLQRYIEEITAIHVNISNSEENFSGTRIYIGEREDFGVTSHDLDNGGYVLKEKDGNLYIAGSGCRGNIYGVYGFLEKYCFCHWYTKDLKVIPKSESIVVPKKLDYTYKPYFEFTDADWSSPLDPEYSLANGLNSGVYRCLSPEQGGSVNYISNFCHTLTTQFCKSETYFAEHPEYFALHDGERSPNQLCLTNPDVLDIVTAQVLSLAKEKYDPSQPLQIISLTQHDNLSFCECERCRAIDEANGSHSGTMLNFVNAVAKKVKEAGYDNIAIDTFAYTYTRKAPSQVKPNDNVIVRLCSIECCFGHPLNDPNCAENKRFIRDLEEWSKICDRLYVWDYSTNYSETINIFPNFKVLQPNMQTFYENNVRGMYVEGNYYVSQCDTEFGELRAYLLSKLMQNPYMDYDAEMNGFLEAYYGKGWKNIREFIDIVCDHAATYKSHMKIYQPSKASLPGMKYKDIKRCDSLWRNAKIFAQNDVCLRRIERSELCWRYWKCSKGKSEFSPLRSPLALTSEREKLYNDLVDFGVVKYSESPSHSGRLTNCPAVYLLRRADKWNGHFESKFALCIGPIVLSLYKFLKLFKMPVC